MYTHKKKSINDLLKKTQKCVKKVRVKKEVKKQIRPIPPNCKLPIRENSLLHQYIYGNKPIDYGSDSD